MTQDVSATSDALHRDHLPRLIGERSVYLEANPAHYALAGKSDNGRRTYISRLNQVARLFSFSTYGDVPWHLLRYEHINYVVHVLKQRNLAHTTINTTLAALRAVAREAFNLGQLAGDDLARILRLKSEHGSGNLGGRHIPASDISALVRVCEEDEGPSGIRDIAIIGLLYVCGLRRAEISRLVLGDFDPVENSIRLKAKSSKKRVAWPDSGTRNALLNWYVVCRADLLESDAPMFTPIRKGGKITGRPMSDQSVYVMVSKRWKQAGVRPCSPHDFRRSFVTNLLEKNVDVLLTQRLAGHSSPATTLRYDRRREWAPESTAAVLHLPYSGKLHGK